MSSTRYYENPNGIRDVLYAHDDEAERAMQAKDAEEIEKILDAAVGRGAIQMDDRFDWRNRLRAEPEFAREILEGMSGHREYAEQAARRDPHLVKLAHDWDGFLGVDPIENGTPSASAIINLGNIQVH